MPLLIASSRGFYGGRIIEPGSSFVFDDDDWSNNVDGRPLWAGLPDGSHLIAPSAPSIPAGNGVQDALGGVAPDWLAADAQPVIAAPAETKPKK